MRTLIAFLAAALVPAILITAWYLFCQFQIFEPFDLYIWARTGLFFIACTLTSTICVILLGVPAFYFLLIFKVTRLLPTITLGFILGATAMAVFSWPLSHPALKTTAWVNGAQTMINGTPTMAGWLSYGYSIIFLGLCGVVSALAFWLIAPNKALKPLVPLAGTGEAGPLA